MPLSENLQFPMEGEWLVPGVLPRAGDADTNLLFHEVYERELVDLACFYAIRDLAGGDPDRAELKALLLAMFFVLSEGGLCVRAEAAALGAVFRRMAPAAGDSEERARRVCEYVRSTDFLEKSGLVAINGREFRPLVYESDGDFIYFQKSYQSKRIVLERVAGFFATPANAALVAAMRDPSGLQALRDCLREVLIERPVRGADGSPLRLAPEQQLAILLGLAASPVKTAGCAGGNFLIVTGGPGTGKTSTVLNLLRGLVRQGLEPERIALTAPTGRAARRLTESLRSGLDRIEQPASGDESLRALHGTTLHRLLRYMPDRNSFLYHRSNPLPFEVLIVDEVSMVDLALMAHLLDAVDPSRTRLICLGDRDQLPSVDAGAVLSDFLGMLAPGDVAARYSPEVLRAAGELLPETRESLKHPSFFQQPAARKSAVSGSLRQGWTDRIVELTWSFRSGDAILRAATAVNQGHAEAESLARVFPALVPVGGGQSVAWPDQGCYLVEEEAAPREGVVLDWIREHFDGEYLGLVAQAGGADPAELPELCARLFAHLNRSRILAIGRRGRAGVSGINAAAARWFHGRLGLRVARPDALFSGMPVLIVRNDHRRELYNGDVGVVLDVRSDGSASPGFRAYFERPGGRFTGYAMETLPTCEAAFALTVHKSQGSEYERVLLVLPDDPVHRLLSREVLYTGLTRARKLAVVYGSPAALTRAVREKLVRETGGLGGPRPPDRAGGGPGL